jgi:ceramide glucosyltransferase
MITMVLQLFLSSLTVAAVCYYFVAIFAAVHFFASPRHKAATQGDSLPVTIMIPLCGADFDAYTNFASFCRQDYSEFQIVFGVRDEDDTAIPVVHQLMGDFPARDIELVISAASIGENRKVSNLHNMLARVKHQQIVIVDSDIRVAPDFLRSTIPLLEEEDVGLVTCFYRAARALNWAARLEAVEITAEFQPSVIVAHMLEGMTFALGAAMITTREKLERIGGFPAISGYLADDYMLGNLFAQAGYRVVLAPYVVETVLGRVGLLPMLKHQLRWARVKRVCRPWGYLGLVLTYGTPLALLNVLAAHGSAQSLVLLAVTLAMRLLMGWFVGVRCLGDAVLRRHFWLLPVRDIFSFLIWFLSLVGRKIEWRGQHFEIADGGTMVPR